MHHIKRSSGPQDTTHVQAPGGATHMADLPTNRTAGGADAAPSTEQVATALSNFSIR